MKEQKSAKIVCRRSKETTTQFGPKEKSVISNHLQKEPELITSKRPTGIPAFNSASALCPYIRVLICLRIGTLVFPTFVS